MSRDTTPDSSPDDDYQPPLVLLPDDIRRYDLRGLVDLDENDRAAQLRARQLLHDHVQAVLAAAAARGEDWLQTPSLTSWEYLLDLTELLLKTASPNAADTALSGTGETSAERAAEPSAESTAADDSAGPDNEQFPLADPDAEGIVIAAAIFAGPRPERAELLALVDPDDFHNIRNGSVWRALRSLAARDSGTATTFIRDEIARSGLSPAADTNYLSRLIRAVEDKLGRPYAAADWADPMFARRIFGHARRVRDLADQRRR